MTLKHVLVLVLGSALLLPLADTLQADDAACEVVSAGSETDTATGSLQNVGQVAIGRASNGSVHMHAGAIACLAAPGGAPSGPMLIAAVSRKTHGAFGVKDIDIPLASLTTTEPRNLGLDKGPTRIVLKFDNPVSFGCGDLTISNTVGGCGGVNPGGASAVQEVTITGGGVLNRCTTLTINSSVPALQVGSDNDVSIKTLTGDSDGSGIVNILDQSDVKNHLFRNVGNPANIRRDVRADGIINILDQSDTKTHLFKGIGVVCP